MGFVKITFILDGQGALNSWYPIASYYYWVLPTLIVFNFVFRQLISIPTFLENYIYNTYTVLKIRLRRIACFL